MSRHVVILGIDGSGKSTIVQGFSKNGFFTSSWKALASLPLPSDNTSSYRTINYIRTLPFGDYLEHLSPLSRASFVLTLAFAEYEYLVQPHLESGNIVISDAFYFRVVAKELVKGVACVNVLKLVREIPQADMIIYIDVDPATAFQRKLGVVSRHETYSDLTFSDFAKFQKEVENECLILVDKIPIHVINGLRPPEVIQDECFNLIYSRNE